MNMFEAIKDSVTARQAAEFYGIHVNRNGFCQCPFHTDKNPSMKLDQRFHCFGCQADGDVIDFAARFFHLSAKEAALKLASDFQISMEHDIKATALSKSPVRSAAETLKHQVDFCYAELTDYRNKLVQWREQYAPSSPDEEPHPCFLEAIHNIERVEYLLDVLLDGSDEEKRFALEECEALKKETEVKPMEPIVTTPIYHESAAYAREHNELKQFRDSHWANIACKTDIEDAIAKHFDGMHLDQEAVTDILDKYGSERVSLVLKATVQVKDWDGRFSNANKDWALATELICCRSENGNDRLAVYAVNSYPAILDGFIRMARQEMKEREQLAEKMLSTKNESRSVKPMRKHVDLER